MPSETRYCGVSTGRIARKSHRCETRATWAADHSIKRGDPYVEHVEFPGGESGYATQAGRPVRMAECAACAVSCGRGHLLPARAGHVTLPQAAEMLDVSVETIKAWQARDRIGGTDTEIPRDMVLKYIKARTAARAWMDELLGDDTLDIENGGLDA